MLSPPPAASFFLSRARSHSLTHWFPPPLSVIARTAPCQPITATTPSKWDKMSFSDDEENDGQNDPARGPAAMSGKLALPLVKGQTRDPPSRALARRILAATHETSSGDSMSPHVGQPRTNSSTSAWKALSSAISV